MTDQNRTQMLGAAPVADPNRTMMGTAPTVNTTVNATVTIKPVQCPVCKTFNPVGMMFCVDCGLIFDWALPADAFGAPTVLLPCLVDGAGREHPIRPGTTVLGRQGDIAIEDGRISRRHAQVVSDGQLLTLEDLGSTNGTKVNGDALPQGTKRPLATGDKVSLGGCELVFSTPGESAETAMGLGGRTAALAAPPVAKDAPAYLVGEGFEEPLKNGANTFGRKADNDVQIADPYVSGKHGLIEVEHDAVYLTDTGSTNGTLLNDAKLAPQQRVRLEPEDEIRLGGLVLKVVRKAES